MVQDLVAQLAALHQTPVLIAGDVQQLVAVRAGAADERLISLVFAADKAAGHWRHWREGQRALRRKGPRYIIYCPVWGAKGSEKKRAVPASVQFQEDEITPGSKVKVLTGYNHVRRCGSSTSRRPPRHLSSCVPSLASPLPSALLVRSRSDGARVAVRVGRLAHLHLRHRIVQPGQGEATGWRAGGWWS